jgi:hypothetical protein
MVHLVPLKHLDSDSDVVTAFCGSQGFEMDEEPFMVPEEFDYVFEPDPRNLCECMPCLIAATTPPCLRCEIAPRVSGSFCQSCCSVLDALRLRVFE